MAAGAAHRPKDSTKMVKEKKNDTRVSMNNANTE